jgi:bifunctional DNA-binding transcriptional regulator/antitoxin component of YhaV-PrlF toxin-antitoxin module
VDRDERPRAIAHTRVSRNHQLTIPRGPFEAARLEVGDRCRVEATGDGRLTLTRIESRWRLEAG